MAYFARVCRTCDNNCPRESDFCEICLTKLRVETTFYSDNWNVRCGLVLVYNVQRRSGQFEFIQGTYKIDFKLVAQVFMSAIPLPDRL